MTRDEILNMPAGREMDALIAERVMGRDVLLGSDWYFPSPYGLGGHKSVPHYSTDIATAWMVVEKLRLFVMPWGYDEWCVSPKRNKYLGFGKISTDPSAPLAICRAALLAVMEEE